MITRLRIKNFKCLADTGDMDIRPLTFLMGPNSSGKTSVLQVLLLVRQTVDSPDVVNPLIVAGDYVGLGSYKDFVYKRERSRPFSFEITFRPHVPLGSAPWSSFGTVSPIREVTLGVEFKYRPNKDQIIPASARYSAISPNVVLEKEPVSSYDAYKLRVTTDSRVETGTSGPTKFYLAHPVFYVPSEEEEGSKSRRRRYRGGFVWFEFSNAFEETFRRLYYMGPIREAPHRFYPITGETPQDVGLRGESAVGVLWAATRKGGFRGKLLDRVNHWLKEFNIAVKTELKRIEAGLSFVSLQDPSSGVPVNLADVGFGASQIFPIIVEGFYAPKRSVIIMEQPEIHLHPRAQAQLGDLLIDIIKDGKTLIVETHSEHLVSRIQRRIAEGTLKREEVAIYYFQPSSEGTQVKEIKLNEVGQFETEGLPEGFFEEGYRESMKYAEAVAAAKSKNKSNG